MIEKIALFWILFTFLVFLPYSYAKSVYGLASLRAVQGVEVFVHCTGDSDIKKLEQELKNKLKSRLEYSNIPIVPYNIPNNIDGEMLNSGGALKFMLTGFKSKDGNYFIYAALQLHQRAYLANSHEYMDCQTWDRWRTGVFKENEIFLEVEDMAREFANDFISAKGF